MEVEQHKDYKNSGRKPGIINYVFVNNNEKEYVVGILKFQDNDIKFVFDKEDYELISNRAWHFSSGNYISSGFLCGDGKKRELYLHNLIMGVDLFQGKGAAKELVDHINRNGLDNRKENLRIVTQSQQNMNQRKKKRIITLPNGCTIIPDDIPKHIWYVRAQGAHGDRFAIEFKSENFSWKGTSSKNISLENKLEQAKTKLAELYLIYPHLNPQTEQELINNLTNSFNKIINLALNSI